MKKVIVNVNLEIVCPKKIITDEEATEFAENYELPSEYVEDSFEIVKILEEE
jgi:hypothetical protein